MFKFVKSERDPFYYIIKDGETVGVITIHFNFYDRSNYYSIGEKRFNYLKDAKQYARENF